MTKTDSGKVVLTTIWPPLKPPTALTKFEVAERQLVVAARLYIEDDDYLAILTLAGAAEDILGPLARRAGKKAMMDDILELDRKLTGGRPFEEVREEVNGARNSIKHAREPKEDYAVFVERGETTAMLLRAFVNYKRVAGRFPDVMERAREKLVAEINAESGPPRRPTQA